jgi:hypothetical protein
MLPLTKSRQNLHLVWVKMMAIFFLRISIGYIH